MCVCVHASPPQADPARVRQQLMAEGVELEEAGGTVQVVEVAATKGVGLQELEDALLLQVGSGVHVACLQWCACGPTYPWA